MTNRENNLLRIVIVALPLILIGWSYSFLASQKQRAVNAKKNLNRCDQILKNIEVLKQKPQMASSQESLSSETTGLIERAASTAEIRAGSILRITPQPPRRIPKTAYKEKPTSVVLKGITLKQFVIMINSLDKSASNLNLKSVIFTPPNIKDTGRNWNVEFVLSYLIFDPIKNTRKEM